MMALVFYIKLKLLKLRLISLLSRKEYMSRHHATINSRRWAVVRRAVFKRDGWRCVTCGRAGRLECDHVTPVQREPGQDPYDIAGLQTLCGRCHMEKTRSENRRPPTEAEAAWQAMVTEMIKA